MNVFFKWGFLAALLLVGCGKPANGPSDTAFATDPAVDIGEVRKTDVAPPRADADPQCPSSDFTKFIDVFMRDATIQRRYVHYPYQLTWYDPQDLEAGPKVSQLQATQMEFPVILPADVLRDEHGVHVEVENKSDDWYQVVTGNDMSGEYSMSFDFRWMQGCWYLTESVDSST